MGAPRTLEPPGPRGGRVTRLPADPQLGAPPLHCISPSPTMCRIIERYLGYLRGRHGSGVRGTAQGVTMAEAVIEERQLLKTLRWYDGFVIALCNPGFLIASLGFTFDSVGVLGSVVLWGISATIGLMQNWIYSETAAMFPNQS